MNTQVGRDLFLLHSNWTLPSKRVMVMCLFFREIPGKSLMAGEEFYVGSDWHDEIGLGLAKPALLLWPLTLKWAEVRFQKTARCLYVPTYTWYINI